MDFKIGDKVKVLRKSIPGEIYWNPLMDKAIGKTYTVLEITSTENVRLETKLDTQYNYIYPPEGLVKTITKNTQLLFNFMED